MRKHQALLVLTLLLLLAQLTACSPAAAPAPAAQPTAAAPAAQPTTAPAAPEPTAAAPAAQPTTAAPAAEVTTAAPAAEPTAAAAAPQPAAGAGKPSGKLTLAAQAAPPSLDPQSNAAFATRMVAVHIYEPLVTFAEDFSVVPMLAESWQVSADGTLYTFSLRKGVKFHNGKEMTSDDVVASFDRFMQVTVRKSAFQLMQKWEAKDPYTFVVTLSAPSGAFLNNLASPSGELSIMPKEIVTGKKAGEFKIPDEIVGTGPYQLAEFKADQYIRLKKFDGYQPLAGERNGLGGGKVAYFDEIEMAFVKEVGSRVAGVETGDYGFADAIPYTELDRLTNNPKTKPVIVKPSDGVYLLFNHANKLSGELKFRQAIQAGMDLDAIGMAITSGRQELYRLNPTIWPNESVWYFEDPEAAKVYNEKNIDKAKQLLTEAGYQGEEVVLVTTRDYDYMYKTIVTLADQLKNATRDECQGGRARLAHHVARALKRKRRGVRHISATGYQSPRLLSPDAWSTFWASSSSSPEQGRLQQSGHGQGLRGDWNQAITMEQRKAKVQEMQKVFYETLPHVNVVEFFPVQVLRSDVQGYKPWYIPRFFGVWSDK